MKINPAIVVIGGGAGGLELVVRLARKLRKQADARVMLIDRNPTHIWKPLLHEVATGSLNSHHDESAYRMLARKHGFEFALGDVLMVDSKCQCITLAAVLDQEDDREMVPQRSIDYSTLVLSVGSLSNDFNIQGVAEQCLMLDSRAQAERFHRNFVSRCTGSTPRLSKVRVCQSLFSDSVPGDTRFLMPFSMLSTVPDTFRTMTSKRPSAFAIGLPAPATV